MRSASLLPARRPGLVLLLVVAAACTVEDVVAIRRCPEGGCAGGGDAFCAAGRPPADLKLLFGRALCTCLGQESGERLTTDSFDSAQGPYRPGGQAGGVGTNGKLESLSALSIGGDLEVAQGVLAGPSLTVAGGLRAGGALLRETSMVYVQGDAAVGGEVRLAALRVGGTLTLPEGAPLVVSGEQTLGALRRAAVTVPPPCPCGAAVDVTALVAARREDNDNAGLDPGRLATLSSLSSFSGDAALALPCGRYYLPQLMGEGALTLRASGRVALHVASGVSLRGLRLDLDPGAELDLLLGGHVNLSGPLLADLADRPGALRIYLGGAGAVNLSGGGRLGGNIYAPGADLVLSADIEVFGALLAGRVVHAAPLLVHYDTDVLRR